MRTPVMYGQAISCAAEMIAERIPLSRDMTDAENDKLAMEQVVICDFLSRLYGGEPEVINAAIHAIIRKRYS